MYHNYIYWVNFKEINCFAPNTHCVDNVPRAVSNACIDLRSELKGAGSSQSPDLDTSGDHTGPVNSVVAVITSSVLATIRNSDSKHVGGRGNGEMIDYCDNAVNSAHKVCCVDEDHVLTSKGRVCRKDHVSQTVFIKNIHKEIRSE